MAISDPGFPNDSRQAELRQWLDRIDGFGGSSLTSASSDASFRRYFRVHAGDKSFIVMDAPPPQEDCLPFIRIAGYLEAMGLNAPRIIEAEPRRGFLLLTDLGSEQYLDALYAEPISAAGLYDDAIGALLQMQLNGTAYQSSLPPYDAKLLEFELSLFHDWLCATHLGLAFTSDEEMLWRDTCSVLIRNALDQPQVFVHRDYHSRNLMVTTSNNPGILDFQDAVEGPLTYDLVSLLKDCYITWPAEQVSTWSGNFYTRLPEHIGAEVGRKQFLRYFELMGVQRHLKAAGIFTRLNHRDGKSTYLADIPRTLSYVVEVAVRYEELQFLSALITERCLPQFGVSS